MFVPIGGLIKLVAWSSVGTVVHNAIVASTPVVVSRAERLAIKLGSWIVTAVVTDAVVNYLEDAIYEGLKTEKEKQDETK